MSRFASVAGERAVGVEVLVTLDREAHRAAQRGELREADVAEFGAAESEVAQAEGAVRVLGVELGEQPGRVRVRREELSRPVSGRSRRVSRDLRPFSRSWVRWAFVISFISVSALAEDPTVPSLADRGRWGPMAETDA